MVSLSVKLTGQDYANLKTFIKNCRIQHNKINCSYQSLSTLDQFMFPSNCVNLKKGQFNLSKSLYPSQQPRNNTQLKKDDHENNTKTLLRSNSCTVKQLAFDQLKKAKKSILKISEQYAYYKY